MFLYQIILILLHHNNSSSKNHKYNNQSLLPLTRHSAQKRKYFKNQQNETKQVLFTKQIKECIFTDQQLWNALSHTM